MTETKCGCGRVLVPETLWRSMTPAERQAATDAGKAAHKGHGKCGACKHRERRGDSTEGAPAKPVPRELVLIDWHWLHETGQLDAEAPLNDRCRIAAPRMGMSVAALEKALQRAGIRNPVDPGLRKRQREHDCPECSKNASQVGMLEGDLRQVLRRLSEYPDNPHLQQRLEEARTSLAEAQAWRDMHTLEHTEMVAA